MTGHLRTAASTSPTIRRILFCGTCDFSIVHLRALLSANIGADQRGASARDSRMTSQKQWSIDVLTPPASSVHARPPPLRRFALDRGLRAWETPAGHSLRNWKPPFTRDDYDLGVVVSFGYFLPPWLIDMFPQGAINVHPSALPRYRGAAPIQHCIMNGDRRTAVSVIEVHPRRFDAGRILRQDWVDINGDPTYSALMPELAAIGARALVDVVQNYAERKVVCHDDEKLQAEVYSLYTVKATAVDQAQVDKSGNIPTAPKIHREDAHIHWQTDDALRIWRIHRAISHQHEPFCQVAHDAYSATSTVHLVRIKPPHDTRRELMLLRDAWSTAPALRATLPHVPHLLDNTIAPGSHMFNPITNTLFIRCGMGDSGRHDVQETAFDDYDDDNIGRRWLGVQQLRVIDDSSRVHASPFHGGTAIDARAFVAVYGACGTVLR